ncbi:hypothetical protein HBH98_077000 [Parastagonospora nodorum]|nr:hypothetical protein HBH51_208480 [Parastagonospora nodorum]KAH4190303.1 hypothetical protein HBH42_127060 [Parastagonospora nodorum]KAH4299850.1 hypothetical protein HBI01_116460 [Parastagonospora nodorum]KAH4304073.1 hypothetical protein HBI02_129600 [Parastagonospora nodorum]KAH4329539.1 hypothetical protein HBI00_091560 [Parastagonospora nodorum]
MSEGIHPSSLLSITCTKENMSERPQSKVDTSDIHIILEKSHEVLPNERCIRHDSLSQLQALPNHYGDSAMRERQNARTDEYDKQLMYWVEQLQTSRPAEMLCDKPRPAALSGQAGTRSLEIGGPLYVQLQRFCQMHGVSQFVVLFAAFRAMHFRLTGQEDATIGTVNANRAGWEVKDTIGVLANMKCLRIIVGDESFQELVKQVDTVAAASQANADVPFEIIVSKLKNDQDFSRHPLVQLVFAEHSQRDLGPLKLGGIDSEFLGDGKALKFDLELHFYQQMDGMLGTALFSTDLFAPETIENMLSVFSRILESCLADPNAVIASLPLMRDTDYSKLDEMGLLQVEKTAYPRDSSVVDIFREQARVCPSRVAVRDASTEMTYAQLDMVSDVLSRWLYKRSLAPETLVGVFAARSCQTIVALLGILKANLAYLPFDVNAPAARVEAILSSMRGKRIILVGADEQPPDVKASDLELISIAEALDEQARDDSTQHTLTTPRGPSATSLAYVMFTSGSTGQPKGVMVEHRGIVRLVRDNNLVQHLPSSPVMAHMAILAFDGSTWEIYASLLRGGTLLDMLCLGGEALLPNDMLSMKALQIGKVVNGYGPTENTTFSTSFLISKDEEYTNGVPIGRALSNSGAHVMDSKLQLVPLGVIGELVLTGDGLARGYTDAQRNINRFLAVKIGGETVRAYRTGDYVRHRPIDGLLEFIGRIDGQVKIRGNRVELGEIEQVLMSHAMVRDAVMVLQRHNGNNTRLAGFVTVHANDEMVDEETQEQLLDFLEARLPAYMVPSTLTILDTMPINQNGKVDRKMLEQRINT